MDSHIQRDDGCRSLWDVWRASATSLKGGRLVSEFMRYTCTAGLLPVVEAALIAKGYTRDDPPRAQVSAATAVVLLRGTTAVLLALPPNNRVAEIEVWGAAQSAVAEVFEALPIELHRLPPRRSALR
jgi:hypothetical protein